jgi:hypothetical protein
VGDDATRRLTVFGRRVRRRPSGDYELRLPEEERELLASLAAQLRRILGGGAGSGGAEVDPSLRRLFPTAYADDPDLDAEYHSLVRDDLRQRHLTALDTVASTIEQPRLDEEQLLAWMAAVNDVRLVLGTRLDLTEDTPMHPPPGHPDEAALAVYGYLGYLLEEIIEALAE